MPQHGIIKLNYLTLGVQASSIIRGTKMKHKLARIHPNTEEAQTIYFDWRNNFLTVERFAEYYETTKIDADRFLNNIRKFWQL